MPPPKHELRTWTLHHPDDNNTYTVSTDPSLLDLTALNDAFASDMLYWAKRMDPDTLRLCVEQSLCFGLYLNDHDNTTTPPTQKMIGLARLVTDYATFGYLTDVYVLSSHQGKGLGKWLLGCLDEVLASWPHLRRCLLFTRGEAAVRMYGATLGARDVGEGSFLRGLVLLERAGGGSAAATTAGSGGDVGTGGEER